AASTISLRSRDPSFRQAIVPWMLLQAGLRPLDSSSPPPPIELSPPEWRSKDSWPFDPPRGCKALLSCRITHRHHCTRLPEASAAFTAGARMLTITDRTRAIVAVSLIKTL